MSKIEKVVVNGYKKVEDTVVEGYKKVEDKFVDTFLKKDGETIETAKERVREEQKQLEDSTSRIIVTTIQKLSEFVKKNKSHPVYQNHLVLIFDECHRSQFGDMHKIIVNSFKKYLLYLCQKK